MCGKIDFSFSALIFRYMYLKYFNTHLERGFFIPSTISHSLGEKKGGGWFWKFQIVLDLKKRTCNYFTIKKSYTSLILNLPTQYISKRVVASLSCNDLDCLVKSVILFFFLYNSYFFSLKFLSSAVVCITKLN